MESYLADRLIARNIFIKNASATLLWVYNNWTRITDLIESIKSYTDHLGKIGAAKI